MKQVAISKIFSIAFILLILSPALSMADPAGPGTDDPFAVPVNGNIAAVAVVAFVYGAYRVYQFAKKNGTQNTGL